MPRKNMSASVGRSVLGAEQLEPRRLLTANLLGAVSLESLLSCQVRMAWSALRKLMLRGLEDYSHL